jgi:hypothetical protein
MVAGVVVSKLRQWEQFDLVARLVVANGSDVLLYCLVLPFSLTVRLPVEGGQEAVIDTQVGANSVPKPTGEFYAAMGGVIAWYDSYPDHVFEEYSW